MIKRITFLLFVLLAIAIFSSTIVGVKGNISPKDILGKFDNATAPFSVSPERARYILIYNLAENNSFSLNRKDADAAAPDVGFRKGKYYILFAPGMSILAFPLYELGEKFNLAQVGSFAISSTFAVLNFMMLFLISRKILRLPFWISLASGIIFCFSSNSWSYAISLYQHQATTFFMLSGIYGAWMFRSKSKKGILGGIWAWTAYAIAGTIDYPNFLLLLPMMIYLFFTSFSFYKTKTIISLKFRPIFIICSVFFIAISFTHGYYNLVNFGGWAKLSGSLTGYKTAIKLDQSSDKNIEATTKRVEEEKNPVGFFSEKDFVKGLKVLTISDERGLFFFFPIFMLAIFGILKVIKNASAEIWTLLGSLVVLLILYSSWGDPWGGWAFGPRYLIPAIAILSLFVAVWLSQESHLLIRKVVTFVLFTFSSGIALLGALTTHSVPPASEAKLLHIGYNYFYNWKFLMDNHGSSFIFNTFVKGHLLLWQYALAIWIPLLLIFAFVIFVMPKIKAYDD